MVWSHGITKSAVKARMKASNATCSGGGLGKLVIYDLRKACTDMLATDERHSDKELCMAFFLSCLVIVYALRR